MAERRGRIVFSATYRPPVPFDIFSCPFAPSSTDDELHLTDGVPHNYNGRPIPPAALKTLLKRPKLANEGSVTEVDVDAGHVSGLVFVSEREDGLETLYIAMRFSADSKVKVFALADIFGVDDFSGMRLEDSGCIGGGYSVGSRSFDHCLIYVSTKEPVQIRHSPGTVVYKTYLTTGKTERLTPQGVFDLSPAVSPSGKMVAVASFQNQSWNSEIENLKTDIYMMNVDSNESEGLGRKLLIKNGGWPSWGSDNTIFFHRFTNITLLSSMVERFWAVFRYDISTRETVQVTPEGLDAVTPVGISETKVAVATFRQKSRFSDVRVGTPYRHIEIFDTNEFGLPPVQVTHKMRMKGDHYNPFVLDGGARIGYHRCRGDLVQHQDDVPQNLHRLQSPVKDVGLFRLSGMFPSISKDGSKLAFVDNEFKAVFVADNQGLRIVYEEKGPDKIFSPVWNQNPDKDILYICIGTSLNSDKQEIYALCNASGPAAGRKVAKLTVGGYTNAYPSSNPGGDRFVFQSTRDGFATCKNLYIMMHGYNEEFRERWEMQLTKGKWVDTHCQWSPNGDWIVFSSTRDNLSHTLDPRYFSLYLVKATDPMVLIRVMSSGGNLGGHISHPVFSPDGRSIAVMANLTAMSVDPVSLPNFKHGVRNYGVIMVVDIYPDNLKNRKYKDVKAVRFRQITHGRYECGKAVWTTTLPATDTNVLWNMLPEMEHMYALGCPY